MSTDQQTIDSYNEHSEEWAKRMRTKKSLSYFYLEKPAMLAQLPDLTGKSVLCLGCGSGEECQMIKGKGADRVVGTDISKGLIEQAKYTYPEVEFEVMDMERLTFSLGEFDIVFSSLAVHYLEFWIDLLSGVKKVLKTGGKFIFSTHHPIRFAFENTKDKDVTKSLLGYELKDDSEEFVVYGDYLNKHAVQDLWFDKVKVTYYHRPFTDIIKEVNQSGLDLTNLVEPKPTPAAQKIRPEFYGINQKIPLFLIVELTKNV